MTKLSLRYPKKGKWTKEQKMLTTNGYSKWLVCMTVLAACLGGTKAARGQVAAICGNGIVEPPEQCDDGNVVSGDGCSATCLIEAGGPQACCRPDGSCFQVPAAQCVAPNSPGGLGSSCVNNVCTERPCCLPNGTCQFYSPQYCQLQGGVSHPMGTTCAQANCPQNCGPTADGQQCTPVTCPVADDRCVPKCVKQNWATGQNQILDCECQDPDECHVVGGPNPNLAPCVVPDNGTGTADLPPAGCTYVTPDGDMHIVVGLAPGDTIEIDARDGNFACPGGGGGGVCSFPTTPADCRDPGGSLGGEKICSTSTMVLPMQGTGSLSGFNRLKNVPVDFEIHTAPRTPGQPVQSFDTDMFRLFGQINNIGDPDFDLLRIVAGTDFGMPSPGHTTLVRQPGGNWAVDSFFDIEYRIDFIGRPGGPLSGHSGSTTGTIRIKTGVIELSCAGPCPPGTICQKSVTYQADGTTVICCDCVPDQHCEPLPAPQYGCQPFQCPIAGEHCEPKCVRQNTAVPGGFEVVDCDCVQDNECHVVIGPAGPTCVGDCPTGQECHQTVVVNADGTVSYCCECLPIPQCQPALTGFGCQQTQCPIATETCVPHCANWNPLTNQSTVIDCDCRATSECRVVPGPVAGAPPECANACPPGQVCERIVSVNADGTQDICCDCKEPPPPCQPLLPPQIGCQPTTCPPDAQGLPQQCIPIKVQTNSAGQVIAVLECDCRPDNQCHVVPTTPVSCTGVCPNPALQCQPKVTPGPNGTLIVECKCPCDPASCDDGNPCTIDDCDPLTGGCTHIAMVCNDMDPCTVDTCDPATGMCVYTPMDCEDGDPCTDDYCDTTGMCQHIQNGHCCQPLPPPQFGCPQTICPLPGEECLPKCIKQISGTSQYTVVSCECIRDIQCHITVNATGPTCVGDCPPGQHCELTTKADGTLCCECHDNPPICQPLPAPQFGCDHIQCPLTGQECQPHCLNWNPATGQVSVADCDCRYPNECHAQPSTVAGALPECVNICPPGKSCERTVTLNADGTYKFCCDCKDKPPVCEPEPDLSACKPVTCPIAGEGCRPKCVRPRPVPPGGYDVVDCECVSSNECHLEFNATGQPYCVTPVCPQPGLSCQLITRVLSDGTTSLCCECHCDPALCDDNNPCTIDECDAAGNCIHTAVVCDDGDPCTTDVCDPATGMCVYTPMDCDDGDPCTDDYCDTTGKCQHLQNGHCCQPLPPPQFGCPQTICPLPGEECQPKCIKQIPGTNQYQVVSCECIRDIQCHITLGPTGPTCVGDCPPGQQCELTPQADGTLCCECHEVPPCEPNSTGTACQPIQCPITGQECEPRCINWNPATGQTTVVDCDCRFPNACHAQLSTAAGGLPECVGVCPPNKVCERTVVPRDNGTGVITYDFCCDCKDSPVCEPKSDLSDCKPSCPTAGQECRKKCVRPRPTPPGGYDVVDCDCVSGNECYLEFDAAGQPYCVTPVCPQPGLSCQLITRTLSDGTTSLCCECHCDPAQCNDNDPCTIDECDAAGNCIHTPVNCNDNDPCTIDSCQPSPIAPGYVCVHTPVNCSDGDPCTIDTCVPDPTSPTGYTCIHTPKNCDDGDCCTADSCDPQTGNCVHTNICQPKFRQPPTQNREDIASNLDWNDQKPNVVVADDFQSDGRRITRVKWWGSYINPEYKPVEFGGAGQPPFMIDGWLISFHLPLRVVPATQTQPPPARPLGLYFAPRDKVRIALTPIPKCDGHEVFEYSVDLCNCCLLCVDPDPRTNPPHVPALPEAFYERHCFWYDLDIQAVVGRSYSQGTGGQCLAVSTLNSADADYWGWHMTDIEQGRRRAIRSTSSGGPVLPDCLLSGPWNYFPRICTGVPVKKHMSMAFELHTDSTVVPLPCPKIIDHHIFYDNSFYDTPSSACSTLTGVNPCNDNTAIGTEIEALLPGETAEPINYISFNKSINGIMLDMAALPGMPTAASFMLKRGNTADPSTWVMAAAPTSITTIPGGGVGGSDRIKMIWANNALPNTNWLQLTVLPTADTGLMLEEVFYWGVAFGESRTPSATKAIVSSTDEIDARNHPHNSLNRVPVATNSPHPNAPDAKYDYDKSSTVSSTDEIIARNNPTNSLNALLLLSPP